MVQMAAASSGPAGRIETSPMDVALLSRSVPTGSSIREIDCSHANDEEYFGKDPSPMDLNPVHVRTLREIARHGSFLRAAESLRMRQLEMRCGTALLERVGKRAFPTRAGTVLLEHAGRAFAELDAAQEALRRLRGVVAGRL